MTVLQTSWTNFVAKTDFYQQRVEQWRSESKMKPERIQPSPADAVDELFATLIDFRLFGGTDQLIVKLKLPVAPVRSNGKWDEISKHISWESTLEQEPESPRLPVMCYATWSIADTATQQAYFGRVILEGEGLLAYCLWRADVPSNYATEWETFLSGLKPDSSLEKKIDSFRFSDETSPDGTALKDASRLASESPRRLLKSALDGKSTPRSK